MKRKADGKVDLVKEHRDAYLARTEPALVTLAPARCLAVDGEGEPAGDAFRAALGALYGTAWTVKMTGRKDGRDFKVPPLEALWWGGAPGDAAEARRRWRWRLLLRVPAFVGAAQLRGARAALAARGKAEGADRVRLVTLREGRCVQALHLGPYADEPATLARMQALADAEGLVYTGAHHEVYLSDPMRTAPARLRTVLRHPVRRGRGRARAG